MIYLCISPLSTNLANNIDCCMHYVVLMVAEKLCYCHCYWLLNENTKKCVWFYLFQFVDMEAWPAETSIWVTVTSWQWYCRTCTVERWGIWPKWIFLIFRCDTINICYFVRCPEINCFFLYICVVCDSWIILSLNTLLIIVNKSVFCIFVCIVIC